MKTTERFDNAITKLYNAFHKGELNAMDCKACAVGNICNNSDNWMVYYDVPETGYSKQELQNIEDLFMFGNLSVSVANKWNPNIMNKETQFKALCGVVEYLCELDNIPNVMEVQSLFEYENETPKNKLTEVL